MYSVEHGNQLNIVERNWNTQKVNIAVHDCSYHRQSRFSRPDWLSASDGIWCRQVSHGRASLPAATQKLHRSAAKLTQCKRQCGSMVPPSRGIRNLCVSCLYRHAITSYIMHAIVLHVLACEHVVECYCKYILYHIVSYCIILSQHFVAWILDSMCDT